MSVVLTRNGETFRFKDQNALVIWKRGFESFESDEALIAYCEANYLFSSFGRPTSFENADLSPHWSDLVSHLTCPEIKRLKELQSALRKEKAEKEAKKNWKRVDTLYFMDNSIEEIWEDNKGNHKRIMATAPHGDICF